MNPSLSIQLVYALWLILVLYLTVTAIGVKQAYNENLGERFGLMFVMIAAFVLPYLPIFRFVNFAPVTPVLSGIGLVLCIGLVP